MMHTKKIIAIDVLRTGMCFILWMVHTFTSVLQCFLFETRTPTTFMHTCSNDSTQEKKDLYSVTNDCIHVCGWNSYTSLSIFHWQHEK